MLLNYPYTNVKETVCSDNTWMRHCSGIDWEGGIKDFLKLGVGSKKGGLYDNNKRINTLCELRTLIYFCVNM